MTTYDDPNRESVGLAPIWAGAGGADPEAAQSLDSMTKAELLDYAAGLGVEADDSMTKAEIRDAIGG